MKFLLLVSATAATAVAAATNDKRELLQSAAEDPVLGTATVHGCYSSAGELQQLSGTTASNPFNSQGSCAAACAAVTDGVVFSVAAAMGEACYCGNRYPPVATLVDDARCDLPCPGFASDACGGAQAFTVINTGVELAVENSSPDDDGGESQSSSSSSEASTSMTVSSSAGTSATTSSSLPSSTSVTSIAATVLATPTLTPTGPGANETRSSSASLPAATVPASDAISRLSLLSSGLGIAAVLLGLGTLFLM